jgi:glc operon protein GlcG
MLRSPSLGARAAVASLVALFGLAPASLAAQVVGKKVLTLDGAKAVVHAAEEFARSKGAGGAIAVVDDGGHLLLLHRLDGTFAMGASISIGKARTAALFQKPTSFFEELVVQKGRVSMTALPDFTPLKGGVPIVVDGEVVGAVGVSGAMSADQDEEMALFATRVLEQKHEHAPAAVTYIQKEAVRAAFQRNAPLFETGGLRVNASRRDAPGEAELHELETDVFYVLGGSATLVTGGTLVGGVRSAPGELRGPRIDGGKAQVLAAGDVLVVPAGTPHWFQSVTGPFDYYVVKTTR